MTPRAWDEAYTHIPTPTRRGADEWIVQNVRNTLYAPHEVARAEWRDMLIHPSQVEEVWLYVSAIPQFGSALGKYTGHTFFGFSFSNGARFGFSIEARRHTDEPYDPFFRGMLGVYPLIYVWATLDDLETRSTVYLEQSLTRYPLTITAKEKERLLVACLEATVKSIPHPRRYNTLTAQCTNLLLAVFTRADIPLPWDIAWHIPGLAPRFLERHGILNLKSKETIS